MTRTQSNVAQDLEILAGKIGMLKSAIGTWSEELEDATALVGGAHLADDISAELNRLSEEVMEFHRAKVQGDKENAENERELKSHWFMKGADSVVPGRAEYRRSLLRAPKDGEQAKEATSEDED
ncbi:MAG: hypothetical protein AAFY04_08110 [Pseudomonadota bacterium]